LFGFVFLLKPNRLVFRYFFDITLIRFCATDALFSLGFPLESFVILAGSLESIFLEITRWGDGWSSISQLLTVASIKMFILGAHLLF
jgi:hypothetical protein